MTEQDIIIGLRGGSHECFRLVYDKWAAALYHYVLSLVKSDVSAQDIVQDTFVKLWERHTDVNPECSIKAYLFTISYHNVVAEFRRQANNPAMADFMAYSYATAERTDARLSFDEFNQRLKLAKEKLTPRQREIFELKNEFDLKPREIEARLGLSNQTVRNQLATAMRIIRKELGDYAILLAFMVHAIIVDL